MKFTATHIIVILALALFGWALCAAIMFVGVAVTSVETTLIVHAIGAPIIFAAISWFYFTRLAYTLPLATAIIFTATVILLDFFLVALVIERSFAVFGSLLGTWIPFVLIFLSAWLTGVAVQIRARRPKAA
jgi:multisubunit Na+/H+ antiporter MnhC subunit